MKIKEKWGVTAFVAGVRGINWFGAGSAAGLLQLPEGEQHNQPREDQQTMWNISLEKFTFWRYGNNYLGESIIQPQVCLAMLRNLMGQTQVQNLIVSYLAIKYFPLLALFGVLYFPLPGYHPIPSTHPLIAPRCYILYHSISLNTIQ